MQGEVASPCHALSRTHGNAQLVARLQGTRGGPFGSLMSDVADAIDSGRLLAMSVLGLWVSLEGAMAVTQADEVRHKYLPPFVQ